MECYIPQTFQETETSRFVSVGHIVYYNMECYIPQTFQETETSRFVSVGHIVYYNMECYIPQTFHETVTSRFISTNREFIKQCFLSKTKTPCIGASPITQLRTCEIKIVTFKGGHLKL